MANMGVIVVVGAVIASMVIANYVYTQYTTNFVEAAEGEAVMVGPVEYVVTFEGTHPGSKDVRAEGTFVQIGITARNAGDERTLFSGGQLYLIDGSEQRHEAVYGEFSETDLLLEWIEPGQTVAKTTQFDIPFDESAQYKVLIRPQKDQSTVDTARICITNC